MAQYSNKAKSCSRSEKDGTILKQGQYLSTSRKKMVNTQTEQHVTSQKKMVQFSVPSQKKVIQYSNKAKNCHKSEKDGTILKQSQNLSAVRKRWYNTETVPKPANSQKRWYNTQSMSKPVTSQKKMVKYSTGPKPVNSQKKMVHFSNRTNLSPVRKRWYNTQMGPMPVNKQEKDGKYSYRANCHQ